MLLTSSDSITAVLSDAGVIPFISTWADHATTTFVPGISSGATDGSTPVTLVSSPAGSTIRQIKSLSVLNESLSTVIVTVSFNSRVLIKTTLLKNAILAWSPAIGWYVRGPNGNKVASIPLGFDQLISYDIKTATGTGQAYAPPNGTRRLIIEVQGGGGGGGGGATSSASAVSLGSGGGAGGYACVLLDRLSTANITYTINTGGGGGNGAAGSTGGSAILLVNATAICTCAGGGAGGFMSLGATVGAALGGTGGAVTAADYGLRIKPSHTGMPGEPAVRFDGLNFIAGSGASSFFGCGGIGTTTSAAGTIATGYGSGGGAGAASNGGVQVSGGAGKTGCVVFWAFG